MFLQVDENVFIQTNDIQRLMRCGDNSTWVIFKNGKQITVSINVHDLVSLLEDAAGEKIVRDKQLFTIER